MSQLFSQDFGDEIKSLLLNPTSIMDQKLIYMYYIYIHNVITVAYIDTFHKLKKQKKKIFKMD